jgi:hypothetical protein
MARIFFTVHAVERFIERWAQDMVYDEARSYLESQAPFASKLKERTILGQEQWLLDLPDRRCVLVTKTTPEGRVCVTVLPEKENFGEFTEEEMEIIREASERLPPLLPTSVKNVPPRRGPPPKPKKPPTKKEVADSLPRGTPRTDVAALHQKVVELAIVREQERTKRYESKNEETLRQLRTGLRVAIRYILSKAADDPLAKQICEELQTLEPFLLTEMFLKDKVGDDVNA